MAQQVFLLGAMKSGTTSMFNFLNGHPDICTSIEKEPLFYNSNEFRFGYNYHYGNQYRVNYMEEKVLLEGSGQNLICKYVAERIKMFNPNAKFIVCVRDPNKRAFSHWQMQKNYRPGYTYDKYSVAIKKNLEIFDPDVFSLESERMASFDGRNESYRPTFIEHGLYYRNIQPYVKLFGLENIFFIDFDDIKNSNPEMIVELANFLEIKLGWYNIPWSNHGVENNKISIINQAEQIWIKDAEQFSKLTGIDFVEKWYG